MDWTSGLNIEFPIYKEDGTSFNGLVLKKATVDTVVMSLGDKITGDVYYKDNSLAFTMHEYVVYKDVKYTIVNPPTVVREGLVRDNSELKGMTKYSFEFYHPMYLLNNLPFADVAVSSDETRYLSENKTFSWIGKPDDFIAKLNKNLEGTEWVVVKSDRFPKDKANTLSQVLQFDKNTIGDAMKKAYEEWDIPYVIDSVSETEQYYGQGKRFKVIFGLPSNEIYETDVDRQAGTPFVFEMGQGVGLKNNSRTPRNNKIVTRLSGYGSERNIPYGYPQIVWTGDQSWTDTKNNPNDPTSYPLYKGIVGGRYVKLIKHPFTRTHLMPSVYRDSVNKKVNPFAQGYNPNIELVDYYDAKGDEYPNKINEASPSYEIHEFDTYPQMNDGSANVSIVNAVPLDKDLNPVSNWDDSMDDEGNYIQSYFQITLPRLSFDIYACAAITEEMKVNMRSGACIGCTFDVQVDWEDYKNNFYDSNGDFVPDGTQRDTNKYPKSNEGSIVIVVKKDNTTFGTLMPNIYRNPKSGDEFVVLGISLPNEYIESAETKLDEEMKSYMLENNVYYYDYPLKFDEYFLATHTNILSQVKTNNIVHFDFSGNLLQLFVKQITIKYGNAPLPQYDITLSDNIEVVLNQIGKVADDVEHLGSLISMLRQTKQDDSYSLGLAQKLSKVEDDTARGLITFLKGLVSRGDVMVNGLLTAYNAVMNTIKSSNYTGDGVADSGWLLTNDYAGSSRLVVDYLYARKKAVFESLEIKELQFTSGDLAQSLASATIERTDYLQVDEQGEETILGYSDRKIPWTLKGFLMRLSSRKPYALARNKKIRINLKPEDLQKVNRVRCYFLAKNEEKTIFNLWKVNDLARCQTFNIDNIDRETYTGETHKAGNVYWWRLVKKISTETVTVDGKEYHYFDVAYGFDEEQEANRTGIRTPWCDILSDLPASGDKVVQFGNTENPARMNIIVSEVNGEGNADAPAIKSYRGVYTFNTDECWWGGESCRKMMLSPSSGVEFYAPSFKFITEYGIERTQVERGAWLAIPFEEDTEHQTFPDYSDDILDENGNFVSRSDGSPKKYVRKCRYYDRVEHKGSTWLCTIAESHYWRKYDNGVWSKITEAQYQALPQEEKDKCEEVRNYTTDEPSKASNDWTVSAERGQDGSFKSRVFCRTNINIKNANVRGGSYDNPIPTLTKIGDDVVQITWEDGVPQGNEMLWSTVCTFYGDGSNSGWSKPSQETDTETLDIEFSPNAIAPSAPVGTAANRNTQETIEARQAQGWYDPSRLPADQQMIYRAECKIKNGVYETKDGNPAWVIARIKGENGLSIINTNIYYYASDTTPSTPSGNPSETDWVDNGNSLITDANANNHLYESTCTTYGDGTYSWTKPLDDGLIKDMAEMSEEFALSDSGTTAPTEGWSTSVTPTAGKWVWSRTVLTFKDGTKKYVSTQCVGYCGIDGKNAVRLDIDNEMDAIQTDSAGVVMAARTVYTVVHLYDGSTEVDMVTSSLTTDGNKQKSGNGIKVSWTYNVGSSISDMEKTIKYVYKDVEYSAVFSIVMSKGQAIYQLKPSMSAIPFQRNSNNALTPESREVGLSIVKIDGKSTEEITSGWADMSLYVRYSTSSMPTSMSGGSVWRSGNVSVQNTKDNLYIAMFNASGVLLDRETVPVVKDGMIGDKGSYYVDDYGIGASRTSHSDITNWSSDQPEPTEQKPYVWKRSRLYNPNTNTYGDATYVCMTGEKGVNGKDGWMITANPANVIITQSLGNNTSSFSSATVSFVAKKGSTNATIASIAIPTGKQSLSDKFNATISGKTVVVSSPKTHGSPAEYYTEGSFTVTINVTDPDTSSTVSFNVTVLCYANLLGTWKREVEAGVETVVAGLTRYLEDEDGNIITSESLRNDINDATQDLSVLSQTVTTQGQTIQSQNTRLSTAEGNINTVTEKVNGLETSTSEIKQTADAIKMSVNSGFRNFVLNPKATDATIGVGQMTEENDAVMGNVMKVYNPNNGDFQLSCKFDDDNRSKLTNKTVTCYAVVKPMSSSGMICFGIWSSSYHEQAGLITANSNAVGVVASVDTSESGGKTGMTAVGNGWYVVWATFNAGYIFSEVKDNCGINSVNGSRWLVYGYGVLVGETCPSLEAIMTYTGLRSAGINIENGIVNLYGDKVTFSDKDGGNTDKVWIDPDDGTIHATDGEFTGKVTANSGKIAGDLDVTGGFNVKSGTTTVVAINGLTHSTGSSNGNITILDAKGLYIKREDEGFRLTTDGFQRWNSSSGSWVNFYGGRYVRTITLTSTSTTLYKVTVNDDCIIAKSYISDTLLNLPSSNIPDGKILAVVNAGGAGIHIKAGSLKIQGAREYDQVTININDRMEFIYSSNKWYANFMPKVDNDV